MRFHSGLVLVMMKLLASALLVLAAAMAVADAQSADHAKILADIKARDTGQLAASV